MSTGVDRGGPVRRKRPLLWAVDGASASRRGCDRKEVSLKVKLVGLERAARVGEDETEVLEELRERVGRGRLRR